MSRKPDLSVPDPVTDDAGVRRIAERIRDAGRFAVDLEFVSEDRYLPELGLVQLAWGDAEHPEVAAVDPLAAAARPLAALVADPEVTAIFHAGQADLSLLWEEFEIRGRSVVDTQVAAAFLGLGDQLGYAALVDRLLGVEIDKGAQFTDWCRRPLSAEQLHYALEDVRHLQATWDRLADRLEGAGRLGWVREESDRVAAAAAGRIDPEEVYLKLSGRDRLKPRSLGALRSLAAWRERTARSTNTPPRWLLQDRPMLEVARRLPRKRGQLASIRGVKESSVRRNGEQILAAVERGADSPVEPPPRRKPLPDKARGWVSLVAGLIQARCREAGIAPRFVANKADSEELVRWWLAREREGAEAPEPDLPLLSGWRRELAGQAALDWLAGELALVADAGAPSGLRAVPAPGSSSE